MIGYSFNSPHNMLYGVEDASNLIFCFQNSYENNTDMDICKHHFNTFFSKRLLASSTPKNVFFHPDQINGMRANWMPIC